MKTLLFACTLLIFCACGSKKTADKGGDAVLVQRLEEFMKATDEMNLERILDYTYPQLFTIAPREEVLKIMKETYDSDEAKIELDSLKVDTLYPVFQLGKASYAKVKYSMVMLMDLNVVKDSAAATEGDQNETIRQALAQQYGDQNVRMDEKDVFHVKVQSPMVAIKDEHSKEWTFLNIKEGDAMTDKLISKEVLGKLATYK